MTRVVVANEYNLRENAERARAGGYARHLLFGVQRLQPPEFDVELVGESYQTRRPLRFVATNVRAAVAGHRADAVYSTFTYGGLLAGLVRRVTGRPRRLVTVVHGLPEALRSRPRLFAGLYRGHTLAFLSPTDLEAVRAALPRTQEAFWIPWGPSEEWSRSDPATRTEPLRPAAAPDEPYVFAIGKSKRDWDTLAEAQRIAGFPLVVVAGPDCPVVTGDRVRVHKPERVGQEALTLAEVKALYRDATVVALPLVEDASLNGSTALGEALASRSIVVMTATRSMAGFATPYSDWVRLVPPDDAPAMAAELSRGLTQEPPATPATLPTAERFEDALLGVLRR